MARTHFTRTARILPVIALALAVLVAAPAAATGDEAAAAFTPQLAPAVAPVAKIVVSAPPVKTTSSALVAAPKSAAPLPVAPTTTTQVVRSGGAAPSGTPTRRTSGGSELAQARSILAGLVAAHPILAGASVTFGDARGYQAIALYQSGRIIISPTHTASLSRILNHEVWHIIDWRDNGRIDWGENVPPR